MSIDSRRFVFLKKSPIYLLTNTVVCVSYNHSRDDEEVYKEFLEIANEIVPQILRMDHVGVLTRDPEAYALLLRFYDGLCCWEEDSQTPVLHITWATHMLSSFGKFGAEARTSVELLDTKADGDAKSAVDKTSAAVSGGVRAHNVRKRHSAIQSESREMSMKSYNNPSARKSNGDKGGFGGLQVATVDYCESGGSTDNSPVGGDGQMMPPNDDLKINLVVDQLASQSDENGEDGRRSSEIDALAHACGESILNPAYLRGRGEPFVKDVSHQLLSSATDTQMDLNAFAACTDGDPSSNASLVSTSTGVTTASSEQQPATEISTKRRPQLLLHSVKMSAVKQLLVTSKLNASAIKLQLTAQSQVARRPANIQRPLSTHFYSDNRHRQAIKRRAND